MLTTSVPRFFRLPRNPLFRLLVVNGILGVFISLLFLAGVFWANIGNLRVLVLNADDPVLPVIMLAVSLVITLGSVVMGSAVMMLKQDATSDNRPGGGHRHRIDHIPMHPQAVPVPARGRFRR